MLNGPVIGKDERARLLESVRKRLMPYAVPSEESQFLADCASLASAVNDAAKMIECLEWSGRRVGCGECPFVWESCPECYRLRMGKMEDLPYDPAYAALSHAPGCKLNALKLRLREMTR